MGAKVRLIMVSLAIVAASLLGVVIAAAGCGTPGAVYDVTLYGAKADGEADDAPAVQAAADAAHAAGGGVVYLPPGTYRFATGRVIDPDLGANVELFDNITVRGAGPDRTFVKAALSWASAFGAIRKKSVSVQDMNISAAGSQQDGVKFGVCRFPLVRNVVAHDIYVGLAFYSCVNPVAKDCKVYDCDTGIDIGQGATWPELSLGGLVEDCEGWGANKPSFRVGGYPSLQKRVSGVVLRHCHSYSDGTMGLLITYAERVRLEDCTSTASGKAGLQICGVKGATLAGCTPPFVSTAENDPKAFKLYGASGDVVVK